MAPAWKGKTMAKQRKQPKAQAPKQKTRKQLEEELQNLRRKIRLLQKVFDGEMADQEFATACGIRGAVSPEERNVRAGVLRHATIQLGYVMMGEV